MNLPSQPYSLMKEVKQDADVERSDYHSDTRSNLLLSFAVVFITSTILQAVYSIVLIQPAFLTGKFCIIYILISLLTTCYGMILGTLFILTKKSTNRINGTYKPSLKKMSWTHSTSSLMVVLLGLVAMLEMNHINTLKIAGVALLMAPFMVVGYILAMINMIMSFIISSWISMA